LYENLDLSREILHLDNIQGGNRVGTLKNPTGVPPISSGRADYGWYPVLDRYDGTEFRKIWNG